MEKAIRHGEKAKPCGSVLCRRAAVTAATARTARDVVPHLDGYGGKDSAEE